MSASTLLLQKIWDGFYDRAFSLLYGEDAIAAQRARYAKTVEGFVETFGDSDGELLLFSAPGRTEIGGNHTDHNHGRVLAGSVNLDIIAVVRPTRGVIRVKSEGHPMNTVLLDELSPREEEKNHSTSLVRGTAARFGDLGYAVDGFEAYTISNVLKGSGLSSSAAFEVLIGVILNHVYNSGKISAVEIARIAQYAENVYFGKPCGLMDQMASSVGNVIAIDFADPSKPIIENVDFDFSAAGHALCIVDVGGSHADLTDEYAAIPAEMRAVAASLGAEYLRETSMQTLLANIEALRERHGDRAVLRAIHFLRDNDRVVEQVAALRRGDFEGFKSLVIESGNSSFEYLQNVYPNSNVKEQGMSLALALAQGVLQGCGAWRVHGGGFGGTTQNFVPLDKLDEFISVIEGAFGEGACHVLNIRPYGGVSVDALV